MAKEITRSSMIDEGGKNRKMIDAAVAKYKEDGKSVAKKGETSSEQRLYNANLGISDSDIAPNMARGTKKKTAKPTVKKLKDTSGDYWSADGISGDMGSASGETGANMGQVNKGGYDADSDGMKRGGKVKMCKGGMAKGGSASSRGDGCAQRGKTRGRFV